MSKPGRAPKKRARKPTYPKSATDGDSALGDAEDTLEKSVIDLIALGLEDEPDSPSEEDFENASKKIKEAADKTKAAEAEIARRKRKAQRDKS